MIQEQLRAISQSQVQNGAVVGPAFATIRQLVAGTDVRIPSGRYREDGGPVSRRPAMRTRSMQP